MFKTKTSKILGFVALFLLIIFSWVMINDARRKKVAQAPVDTGLENPFGGNLGTNTLPSNTENTSDDIPIDSSSSPLPSVPSDVTIVEQSLVLKKLSNQAVTGFAFIKKERVIEEDPATTPDAGIVEVYDFSGYKTVRFGDTKDEIEKIKIVLNRQTPSPALEVNPDYDTDMKNAVIEFQNKNGLTGDGVIGSKTYAKLNAFQGITTYTPAQKTQNIEIVDSVRFVESSNGFVYDRPIYKNELAEKITTTTIPRVAEAYFDNTGDKIVMRYLKDEVIETYLVNLIFPKIDPDLPKVERDAIPKTAEIDGDFLPENIETVSVSYDHKNFFYMNPANGGVAGITYNFVTKAKKQIFETPLTEWIADWGSENKINITTKASGLVPGYSYMLDAKNKTFDKNLGNKSGLTTLLSPDGKKLLYAEYNNNQVSTFILDMASGKTTTISPNALPEKCVWTKNSMKIYCAAVVKSMTALYPDDWYKGKISFDDALWMIDLSDYRGNIIYDFISKNREKIDATHLELNSEENYLGFINKKDGILWGFDLTK